METILPMTLTSVHFRIVHLVAMVTQEEEVGQEVMTTTSHMETLEEVF